MNNVENRALRRVLLVYRELIPSIRLCGHCQLESLAKRGIIEYRAVQEMSLSVSDMNWAEIAVLGRLDSWYEMQIAKRLRRSGRYVIYILDDDLLNIARNTRGTRQCKVTLQYLGSLYILAGYDSLSGLFSLENISHKEYDARRFYFIKIIFELCHIFFRRCVYISESH